MKKINIIYGLLAFTLLVSMCSCGARKSTVDKSKEETKIETVDKSQTSTTTDINLKTTTTIKVDDKNETVTEETVYEPSNNSKESFVIEKDGTKVILNNAKKIVRKTTQNNSTITALETNAQESKKESINEQKAVTHNQVSSKEVRVKEVDKKQFNPLNLILIGLGVLALLYVIYLLYKKFILP